MLSFEQIESANRGVFLEKRTIKEKSYAFALQIIALSRELSARNEIENFIKNLNA